MGNTHTLDLYVTYPPIPDNPSRWQKFKFKCYRSIQVSAAIPSTIEYFKSEVAILKEKKRHYRQFRYIVHPLSKFNYIYQIWCFFFYGLLVFSKMFDFGFLHLLRNDPALHRHQLLIIALALDMFALINACLQFCIGFCKQSSRTVELSRLKISKKYLTSGHFFCDVLSSIPRGMWKSKSLFNLVVVTLTLLKMRRISTIIQLIKPTAQFLGIKSSSKIFLWSCFIVIVLVMHIMTCFHAGIPQYRAAFVNHPRHVYVPTGKTYMKTFFKCAQYTFLIQVDIPKERDRKIEEAVFGVINYFIGKFVMMAIWIVLLFTFLSQRMLKVKFEEIMTELSEYMMAKKLPETLRRRLVTYYKYRYQKVFFNETLVKDILSENLKRETDIFLCKSLINHVTIFSYTSPKTIKQVVTHLVPQIFLPNDAIYHSGMTADCMYFIESGTVAIYTPSGKEVGHLQDGAYFGEACMVLKIVRRLVSVKAIEITRVYSLSKHHFHRCFRSKDAVYKILLEDAQKKMSLAIRAEEEHKNYLFKEMNRIRLKELPEKV